MIFSVTKLRPGQLTMTRASLIIGMADPPAKQYHNRSLKTPGALSMISPRLRALRLALVAMLGVVTAAHAVAAAAEDGYRLWLRYTPVTGPMRDAYAAHATGVSTFGRSPTLQAAVAELDSGLAGMLGAAPAVATTVTEG